MKHRRGWSSKKCNVSLVRDCLGTSLVRIHLWRWCQWRTPLYRACIVVTHIKNRKLWQGAEINIMGYCWGDGLTIQARLHHETLWLYTDWSTHESRIAGKDQENHADNCRVSFLKWNHRLVHKGRPCVGIGRYTLEQWKPVILESAHTCHVRHLSQTMSTRYCAVASALRNLASTCSMTCMALLLWMPIAGCRYDTVTTVSD